MSEKVQPGDRVWVYDEGLVALNRIMGYPTEGPAPNNTGTVASDEDGQDIYADSGSILINFDDGISAPYPLDVVHLLSDGSV